MSSLDRRRSPFRRSARVTGVMTEHGCPDEAHACWPTGQKRKSRRAMPVKGLRRRRVSRSPPDLLSLFFFSSPFVLCLLRIAWTQENCCLLLQPSSLTTSRPSSPHHSCDWRLAHKPRPRPPPVSRISFDRKVGTSTVFLSDDREEGLGRTRRLLQTCILFGNEETKKNETASRVGRRESFSSPLNVGAESS